jgi:hypothetical protein
MNSWYQVQGGQNWIWMEEEIANRFFWDSHGNLRRYDMNGRSQMQGSKNWILPQDKCKLVLLRLSLAGNLEKPLMSLYGTEWRERSYGLWKNHLCDVPL